MSIAGAVAKLFVEAAGEVLVDVAKRALTSAKQRLTQQKPAIVVHPPIGKDRFVAGLFDGIDRERARQLQERQTELARQQLDERSDEK
jgi:hypothetical protein